jgi:type I restriction enzyme R subunit
MRLAFDYVASDRLQDMVDANFKFYKRITEDKDFGKFLLDWLFDQFRKSIEEANPETILTGDERARES